RGAARKCAMKRCQCCTNCTAACSGSTAAASAAASTAQAAWTWGRRTKRTTSYATTQATGDDPTSSTSRTGQPMGWEVLAQWGDDVARIEPLAGGVANDVWRVRVNGRLAVGRLGARSDADLAWETALLQYLDRAGLTVPLPIPTTDGRLFA